MSASIIMETTESAVHIDYANKVGDHFEVDEKFEATLAFPCCVCTHRNNTDLDEPCIHCSHNLRSEM